MAIPGNVLRDAMLLRVMVQRYADTPEAERGPLARQISGASRGLLERIYGGTLSCRVTLYPGDKT